jgi:hypothetical protein
VLRARRSGRAALFLGKGFFWGKGGEYFFDFVKARNGGFIL